MITALGIATAVTRTTAILIKSRQKKPAVVLVKDKKRLRKRA